MIIRVNLWLQTSLRKVQLNLIACVVLLLINKVHGPQRQISKSLLDDFLSHGLVERTVDDSLEFSPAAGDRPEQGCAGVYCVCLATVCGCGRKQLLILAGPINPGQVVNDSLTRFSVFPARTPECVFQLPGGRIEVIGL